MTDEVTGLPLVGVRADARIGGVVVATSYTCADGNYEIPNLVSKSATTVTVEFSSPNYETKSLQTTVSPGQTQEASTPLAPKQIGTYAIAGSVSDGANPRHPAAIKGARVTLTGDGKDLTTTTDSYGAYAFTDLPAGRYTVEASALNFKGQSTLVTAPPPGSSSVDFTLQSGTGRPAPARYRRQWRRRRN